MSVVEKASFLLELLSLPKEIEADIADVFRLVYEKKFTGPITFHCHQGKPRTVEIPPPQIKLVD